MSHPGHTKISNDGFPAAPEVLLNVQQQVDHKKAFVRYLHQKYGKDASLIIAAHSFGSYLAVRVHSIVELFIANVLYGIAFRRIES